SRSARYAPDGNRVAEVSEPVVVDRETASEELAQHVAAPWLWSDETPHLYTTVLELLHNGQVVHTTAQPVRFRSVEVRDEQLLLNGKPVELRGVNRHAHDPRTDRAVSRQR